MSDLKLSTKELTHLWQAAQDQAVTGVPAPFHFAKAVVELQTRRTQPEATQVAQYTCQRHVDEVKKGGACVWCQLEDAIAKSPMPGEVTLRAMYQPTNPPRLMGYDVIDASGKLIGVIKPDVWMGELPADGTKLYTAPAQDLSAAILALPENRPDHWNGDLEYGYRKGFQKALSAAAALASSANALSAGDSEKALDALLTRIDDAFEAYERYGGICEFEGSPMIYADTLTEIVTLRGEYHAILQSQKAGPCES